MIHCFNCFQVIIDEDFVTLAYDHKDKKYKPVCDKCKEKLMDTYIADSQ